MAIERFPRCVESTCEDGELINNDNINDFICALTKDIEADEEAISVLRYIPWQKDIFKNHKLCAAIEQAISALERDCGALKSLKEKCVTKFDEEMKGERNGREKPIQ